TNNLLSNNWSGYQVTQRANYAQGGWTVPTVTAPVPGYSTRGYYSSTWAGIGGGFNSGTGALIQAGTTQDVAANGATTYYAWYEIVGGVGDTGSERRINNLPVHPGDFVGGVGLYTAAGGAQAGVCNFTINTCVSVPLTSSPPGTTAEWIVEAPYSGGILPIADFHSVTFSNSCWALTFVQGGPCSSIRAGGAQPITLQQYAFGAWQNVAIPGALSADGGGFTDSFYQPRPQGPPCGHPGQPACP
ncbi:G1 family glutamic endopeptidase, partial [Kutzneria sp. 744]|uniref:G1 family glutamic endopeptidase n=1 Tax=Kutzneria sp. (strain 744) TaxID=345341 RepID=UPI0005BC38D3